MTWPFPVPDWLPWWVPLAVLVPALLYLLVFLLMPFSVFGLKSRLDLIDERLDEIQAELERIGRHAPEPPRRAASEPAPEPPPYPPPPRPPEAGRRIEPRLDWPRS